MSSAGILEKYRGVTVKTAAEILGVSTSTIINWTYKHDRETGTTMLELVSPFAPDIEGDANHRRVPRRISTESIRRRLEQMQC